MMQRAPLREVAHIDSTNMPDQRSTKHTPDKTTDKAAVTVAAKLLDSAKKSQTKRLAKKMKLSLHKAAGSAGGKKQTARTLALYTTNDLNDTVEFKDSMPVRSVAKPPHASRKRKVAQQPQQAPQKKRLRQDREDAQTSAVSDCSSEVVQNTIAGGRNANNLLTREVETVEAIDTDESSAPHTSSHGDKDMSQCDQDLSTSLHTCPTCGETMPQRKLVHHRTRCLKKQFGRCKAESAASNDDDKPCTAREHHTGDSDEQNHGKAMTTDYFFCQLCQKDLSHMNSHRRTLHINHCIDQEEKRKKTEEERQQALEAAKIQVLDCPMCGKALRTALGRKSHLKKCASSLGVQPDQLLAAVKRQEEEHQATLAAGILPTSYRPGRQNATSTHRGVAALPKSKLDEDTQLALAISCSLRPDTESDAGPSTSENAAPLNRRGRKNKQEDDYLLMKLTESQAADRIATRVSDLLMQQQEEEVDEDLIPPLPAVSRDLLRVCGDRKQTLQWSADETDADAKMFWRRACLESQSSITAEVDSDPSMEFYVGALMPPVEVSRVVAGSKIRRMSEIPGRMGSQQVKMLSEAMEESSQQVTEKMEESSDDVSQDRPPPSTQTAALLADMAAEADGMDGEADGMDAATQLSSACLQTSAVDVESQVQQDLQSDFSSLVNQQEFSDVMIRAAGATTLYAHRVILSVRCPALLKMSVEGSGIVDLSDCSPQGVVSLLNFVYAGVTEVDDRWIQHTLTLADRFGLRGFAEICRSQLPAPASQRLSRRHSGDTTENYFTAHSPSSPVSAREEDAKSTADNNLAAHTINTSASVKDKDQTSLPDTDSITIQRHGLKDRVENNTTSNTISAPASGKEENKKDSSDSITIQRHDLKDRVENNTTLNTISAPDREKEENKIDSLDSIRIDRHYPGDVAENSVPVCSFGAPVGAEEEDKMSLTDSISGCESVDAESEIHQNSIGARQRRKEQEELALESDSGHSEQAEAHRITDCAQHSEVGDRTQQTDDADMTEKLTESPVEVRESPAKLRDSRLETRESLLNSASMSTSDQKDFYHMQNKRKLKRGEKTQVDSGEQEKGALLSATRDSSCPVGGALSTETDEASNTEADQAEDFFSAEQERDLREKIQTVCRMVDEEGDIQAVNTASGGMKTVNTASGAMKTVNTASGGMKTVNTASGGMKTVNTASGAIKTVNTASGAIKTVNTASGAMKTVNTASGGMKTVNTASGAIKTVNTASGAMKTVNTASGGMKTVNAAGGGMKTVNTASGGMKTVNTAGGGMKTVNTASGSMKTVNTASGGMKTVNTASGGMKTVNTASGGMKTVNTASGDIQAVNTASGGMKTVNTASGGMKTVNAASGGMKTVNTASGGMKTVNTASGDIQAVNTASGGMKTVNTASGGMKTVNTASGAMKTGKTAHSAESMNVSFSEDDDVHLLDVSLPSESTEVTAGDDQVRRKEVQQADETTVTAGQLTDPVDSIEISDDDLFSSDEIDISLLPSTPQHSGQIHASQKPNLEERSETCGSSAAVEEGPPTLEPQALTKTVLAQDGQQTEDSVTNSSGEVRRGGRDEVKDTFMVPSPTARPHMSRQGQPAPGFEDSVSCFGLSAVESSYKVPSLSSPNVTLCFKTSTPQAGANSQSAGRTVSRTETGLASDKRNWFECGEQSVTDLTVISRAEADRPELMPAHSKELSIMSDFRSPATTSVSSSTVICEATGTQRVSVVEQDSLYITPVVEQGRIRRTFQLVTPASQYQGASLSPTTPTSRAVVGLNVSPEVHVGKRLEREFRSQQCDSAGDSSRASGVVQMQSEESEDKRDSDYGPASAGMRVESGGVSEDKMDSDSDLEIIDTSLQDPPSPKFSLSSKPTSSQSQTGAQPSNQHSPDPQPLTLSRYNSTPVTSSQSKTKPSSQLESHRKSRSGVGETSAARWSCDRDTARSNPGTPVSGLSQRSADSDGDLVRAVEIVSQRLAAAVTQAHPVHLADCEKSDLASPVEADVWEGFDNLDIYNPDLDLIGHDPAPNPNLVTSPTDTAKTEVSETVISPAGTISRSGMKSTSASTTAESAALSFKTPMKLPLTILAESPESSPESSPQTVDCDALEQSKDTNTVLPDGDAVELSPFNHKVSQRRKYNETPCDRSSTPVRFRSLSKSPPSSRMTSEQREGTEKRNSSHLEEPQSPGGFFVPEDDDAAADSSFLWCEENAPVENDETGRDDSMRAGEEGVLVLGREEIVPSLDSERPVLTPTMLQQRKKKGGKSAWVPPSPFTPMPAYDNMNTPGLKQEVQKYGLKAVGKKRMKLILTDIYHKTHQYETDSDCEAEDTGPANLGPPVLTKLTGPDDQDPSKQPPVLHKHSAQAKLKNTTGPPPRLQKQPQNRRKKQDEERQPPCLHREADESEDMPPVLQKETEKNVAKRAPKTKRGLARESTEPMKTQSRKKGKPAPKTLPSQDDAGDFPAHPSQLSPAKRKGGVRTAHVVSPVKSASDCYSSPEKGSFSSSQDSDVSGCPDVSVLERSGADSDDDDDITPSQQTTQDLPQKLMEFFKTQPGLYHKVLTYEPLDMAVLKCSLKECGVRCPQDKLRKFLDEKCITFTTKNMVPRKQKSRTRKHPRKKSAASQK